jgi:UDP-N-acetylglucosamine--N-acetylmuramyl-(pentapeptide) pyrophosphoryl-undecaprenol N-acetylglucosamine transferase
VKKLLISTGGTGGHVIPAEIIGEHLKDIYEINFSTDLRGFDYFKSKKNKTVIINSPRLNLDILFPLKIIKIFYLTIKSILFLKKEKIFLVISTGGYMSLPICIAAKILGLKIFLLEPNLILGKGNKFFLNFSKKIICYSNNIKNFPKKFISKLEIISPLVDKNFYEIKKKETINDIFCLLVAGGSQGAKIFDEIVKEAIVKLSKKHTIRVIQQTKIENKKNLQIFYEKFKVKNEIFHFEKNFYNLINQADLCITRAGATSLAEISIMNKPFIAIPLPTAKDDHQMENAKFYEAAGCCWVINQKTLDKDKLNIILDNILNKNSDYTDKKSNLKKLNYQNSWNDVNQKIKKIINEN